MSDRPRLTLRRFNDVHAFEALAQPFLMEREAEHNLFLGICSQIAEGRYADPYLVSVERDDRVVAAAFRTPPHQLGLSHVEEPQGLRLIAEDARAAFDSLPGAVGTKSDVEAFARTWREIARVERASSGWSSASTRPQPHHFPPTSRGRCAMR